MIKIWGFASSNSSAPTVSVNKALGNQFSYKSSLNICDFLAISETLLFK